jgi:hypothetical protein
VKALVDRFIGPPLRAVRSFFIQRALDRLLQLEGRQASLRVSTIPTLESLADAEYSVYSQWGEDGILDWLLTRLPVASPRFVEFGVEDYRESNTRWLILSRNWKGLVMDSSVQHIDNIRKQPVHQRCDLQATLAMIDRDNINQLLQSNGMTGPLGVLSIDIDGNDYWVWEAIHVASPALVVCEYNAVFGDLHAITIPYDKTFYRTERHCSNLYFGASIGALKLLAARKGYTLLGSNLAGVNAFFLRDDLLPLVGGLIKSKAPRPSMVRESRNVQGELTFVSGLKRAEAIRAMPVVRLEDGKVLALGDLGPLYSDEWLRQMGCSAG